ncbi:hypothetical protein B5807_10026 [Epicoccum nigrum]|uniref:Uncharacterized protein n=1 Tax=Epicoccum nigrum TaxID=105696 RepID=A0A1Y2LU28_EPING|nr:hypothetical protein B5807_10026 [Epicoccum nigrum]
MSNNTQPDSDTASIGLGLDLTHQASSSDQIQMPEMGLCRMCSPTWCNHQDSIDGKMLLYELLSITHKPTLIQYIESLSTYKLKVLLSEIVAYTDDKQGLQLAAARLLESFTKYATVVGDIYEARRLLERHAESAEGIVGQGGQEQITELPRSVQNVAGGGRIKKAFGKLFRSQTTYL